MEALEKSIANEIVNIGLGKAAESLAFFTREKAVIKGLDVKRVNISELDDLPCFKSKELNFVLTTEIKGELSGVCYLIFSEQEVDRLLKVSLPASVLNDPNKLTVMGDAILLEMDNIIVASVVTQFSNFFNYKMYGDVPRLSKATSSELKAQINEENKGKTEFIFFNAELITEKLDINPDFIWVLDDKYFEGVKSVAGNSEMLQKLNLK